MTPLFLHANIWICFVSPARPQKHIFFPKKCGCLSLDEKVIIKKWWKLINQLNNGGKPEAWYPNGIFSTQVMNVRGFCWGQTSLMIMRNGANPSANPGWRSSAHVLLKDGQGLFPWESAKNHDFLQTRCTPLPLLLWWLSHDLWKTISPIVPSWNPTFPGPKIQKYLSFTSIFWCFPLFPHSLINHIKIKLPCHVSKFFWVLNLAQHCARKHLKGHCPKNTTFRLTNWRGFSTNIPTTTRSNANSIAVNISPVEVEVFQIGASEDLGHGFMDFLAAFVGGIFLASNGSEKKIDDSPKKCPTCAHITPPFFLGRWGLAIWNVEIIEINEKSPEVHLDQRIRDWLNWDDPSVWKGLTEVFSPFGANLPQFVHREKWFKQPWIWKTSHFLFGELDSKFFHETFGISWLKQTFWWQTV